MKHAPRNVAIDWLNTIWETDLPSNAKLVACNMRRFMNSQNDTFFPGRKRIGVETGLSRATVTRALALLKTEGWIIVIGASDYGTNLYKATYPQEIFTGGAHTEPGFTESPGGGSQGAPKETNSNKQEYIGFDIFWDIYPRKVGKANAEKAWAKIKCDQELFDRIHSNIRIRCGSGEWTRENMTYIPHATTYLNGKRWEDEPAGPQQARQIPQAHVGTTRGRTIQEDLTDTSWAE